MVFWGPLPTTRKSIILLTPTTKVIIINTMRSERSINYYQRKNFQDSFNAYSTDSLTSAKRKVLFQVSKCRTMIIFAQDLDRPDSIRYICIYYAYLYILFAYYITNQTPSTKWMLFQYHSLIFACLHVPRHTQSSTNLFNVTNLTWISNFQFSFENKLCFCVNFFPPRFTMNGTQAQV